MGFFVTQLLHLVDYCGQAFVITDTMQAIGTVLFDTIQLEIESINHKTCAISSATRITDFPNF